MSEPNFAMICCACGAEQVVKESIAAQGWRLAFSRPGFVTAKHDGPAELPQGVFIRTVARSIGSARSDEAEKQKALEKAALNRTLLGVASIVGAIFIGVSQDNYNPGLDTLTDVMVIGGAAAIKSGMDKRSEATIHRESIEELGASFSSEARPLVVDVEGKVAGARQAG